MSSDPITGLQTNAAFVHRLAAALFGQRGDDLAQEALLRSLRAPPRHGGSRSYWRTIFTRLTANASRGERRRAHHETTAAANAADAALGLSPQQVLEREETRRRVLDAVLTLDEPFRQVVLLRFYEGLTDQQAAARLGVPVGTVRSRQHRALTRLRQALGDERDGLMLWIVPWVPPVAAAPIRNFTGVVFMKNVCLLVAAVLVTLLALAWRQGPALPVPNVRSEVANVSVAEVDSPRSTTVATVPQRIEVYTGLEIRVVDRAGEAVADAEVFLGPDLAPWLPDGAVTVLGSTNDAGVVRVGTRHFQAAEEQGLALHAKRVGFRLGRLEPAALANAVANVAPIKLVLDRGHRQVFSLRTRGGVPVVGRAVVLSRIEGLDEFLEVSSGRPGATFEAVHRAVSGQDGNATFEDLDPGDYTFRVAADVELGVVAGRRSSEGVAVPGPPVDLVFDQLLAGGLVVRGDEVVSYNVRYYPRQHGSSFAASHEALLSIVRAASPGVDLVDGCAWFGFPHERLLEPVVSWRLLLARTGWHEGTARLRPLAEGLQPGILTITDDVPDAPMGEVRVEWPARLPALPFNLEGRPRTERSVYVPITVGRVAKVPPGGYEVSMNLGGNPNLLAGPHIEVVAGEVTVVPMELPDGVAIAEVRVAHPSGRLAPRSVLRWAQRDRDGFYHLSAQPALILLPVGTVDLVLTARGCQDAQVRVEIVRDRSNKIDLTLVGR